MTEGNGKMRLADCASVRSGLVLARKQAKLPTGNRYSLINLRSVQQDGSIDLSEIDVYDAKEPLKGEYLSQEGDVIVRLTAPYTAVLIDDTTSNMVVSSNFVIIRACSRKLVPGYLYWLLNTREMKRRIFENTTSNMLGAVKAKYLAELELPSLPIQEQIRIAQLHLLANREGRLLRQLAQEKQKYYAGLLEQAHKKAKEGGRI